MIGHLKGTLISKAPAQILLEVKDIGYEIELSLADFANLPEIGENLLVYTHLLVREDAQLLYGFLEEETKQTFRQLIKANGVGAKLAMVILSGLNRNELALAIENKDISSLTLIPGIGKKTAERLIIELSGKLSASANIAASSNLTDANYKAEAEAALVALGYKQVQAKNAVHQVAEANMNVQQILRLALQQIK